MLTVTKGDTWDFVSKGIMCECDYTTNVAGAATENIESESVVAAEASWADASVSHMTLILVPIDPVLHLAFPRAEYIN